MLAARSVMESHEGAIHRALGLDSRLRGNDRVWGVGGGGGPPKNGGSRGLKAWFRDKLVLVSLAYYGYD
jgi:hypothetical protein